MSLIKKDGYDFAFNPDKYPTFQESAIMNINYTGGKLSYFLTNFLFIISLTINFSNTSKGGIFKMIIAYSYISLFLFKEAASIPVNSSLFVSLFFAISQIIHQVYYR